jgi:hypothetical protein
VNIAQVKEKAIKLINYYSVSGTIITASDPNYSDYVLRMPSLIDSAQKEIATTAKSIRKQHAISQNPIISQLNNPTYNFDIVQHLKEDISYSATGSKAYTFKVDNPATIYIEESADSGENWTVLDTITHTTPKGKFTEYKDLITLSDDEYLARIRFSGDYVYNLRDVALFDVNFASDADIPQYKAYVEYTMPTDFYKLVNVSCFGQNIEGKSYRAYTDFYWNKTNVLSVNYYKTCEFDIDYIAYPTTITDATADNTELEIDLEAQEAIPYYVASHMMMDENGNINNKLYAMYQGKVANLNDNTPNGSTQILNTMYVNNQLNNNSLRKYVMTR